MNRRQFLKRGSMVLGALLVPVGWGKESVPQPTPTTSPSPPTYFVAAYDSPRHIKESADIVCNGWRDNVKIQEAIDGGGRVIMAGGTFHMDKMVDFHTDGSIVTGCHFIGGGLSV